jgi:histidyl-tRNA synthetase
VINIIRVYNVSGCNRGKRKVCYGSPETPRYARFSACFENIELFTLKSGEGILGELYNFMDKGGREIALRPELTAPVIRMYVKELQKSAKPLKFYYFDN